MKKSPLQQRTVLLLLIPLLLIGLVLTSRYNLLPLPSWVKQVVPSKTPSVTTALLSTTNKSVQLLRTGSVESPKSAPVHAEFSGRITEVYVTEGQQVKVDQPLVKILYSSLKPKNGSNINTERTAQTQTQYDNALKEYNRLQNLYNQGAIPKRQLDNAQAILQAAMSSSSNVQSPAPDNNVASTSSSTVTITAPNPGTVTGLAVSSGKFIEAGQPMMTLDVGEVQLVVHIEQKDLYLIHPGTPATVEVSGQTINGQVANIYPEAGINNLPSFRAHINIPKNTDGLLKPGMSVNVRIITDKSALIHTLPKAGIFQDEQGNSYVYLLENGKVLRQQVTIGETLADSIEITSKLPEQAVIITSHINNLKDGDPVTVLQ